MSDNPLFLKKPKMVKYIQKRKAKLALFGVLCVALIAIWMFRVWDDEIAKFLAQTGVYFRDSVGMLKDVPLFFYSFAIFILPIFFLPVTPVFILASARIQDESYALVLMFCLLGVTANVLASYFISQRFGTFLRGKLSERNITVPSVPDYEHYELTFLMRMIPGNPLAVQNYVLGAANISFFKYVVVSLPIQYVQIAAYVYFGDGIFDGKFSKIILGSSLLLIIAIIARMLDKRYGHKLRHRDGISKTK